MTTATNVPARHQAMRPAHDDEPGKGIAKAA